MARKALIRVGGDVREHPQYSIEDVARYLHIPRSTVKAWCRGQHYTVAGGRRRHFDPVITPADPKRGLLSFYNLAEAHVLRATRGRRVPMENVRRALEYVREALPKADHPLLTHEFMTYGKCLFVEHLGSTINATAHGQLVMRQVLDRYLERIERDALGMPIQIYPMTTNLLAINPGIASGQPVVKGTRVMAEVLAARRKAGESYEELVQDYSLTRSQVEQAIAEYACS